MAIATASKIEALRDDFGSGAAVADLLGVSRSRVTRWLKGEGIDPLNAERVDLLELVWSNLGRIYDNDAAREWLLGPQPEPRRPPADRPDPCRARRGAHARDPGRARRLVRVILYRCFAWDESARASQPDGALWFPRIYQGDGRHDNPDVYGCLYLADREVSCVVEQLARFRGRRLVPGSLVRRGLPLALAALELPDDAELVDLDDPAVLDAHELRPSQVATRDRAITQPQALALHERHPEAAGLRWWSVYEALWANVTLFDRAAPSLRLADIRRLDIGDAALAAAADHLGLTA